MGCREGCPSIPPLTSSCRRDSEGQVTQLPPFTGEEIQKDDKPRIASYGIRAEWDQGLPRELGARKRHGLQRGVGIERRASNTESKLFFLGCAARHVGS